MSNPGINYFPAAWNLFIRDYISWTRRGKKRLLSIEGREHLRPRTKLFSLGVYSVSHPDSVVYKLKEKEGEASPNLSRMCVIPDLLQSRNYR